MEIVGIFVDKVLLDYFFNMRIICSCSFLMNLIKVRKDIVILNCFKNVKRIFCNIYLCKVCKFLFLKYSKNGMKKDN